MHMVVTIEEPQLFRLNAKQYEQMCELGILPEHGVELIDGLVVEMSAQGDRHIVAVRRLNEAFVLASRGRYAVDPQCTAEISDRDEPDPDVVISRDHSSLRRSNTETIVLIVEVADTSLKKELNVKRDRYARAGIGEYRLSISSTTAFTPCANRARTERTRSNPRWPWATLPDRSLTTTCSSTCQASSVCNEEWPALISRPVRPILRV